jgi:hypothetical protein
MLVDTDYRNLILRRNRGEICFVQMSPFSAIMNAKEADFHKGNRTEIPVPHFTDLLRDTIAPWRLAEDGFQTMNGIVYALELRPVIDGETVARRITVITDTGKVYLSDGPTNVTTYTQLLTLIRLIG